MPTYTFVNTETDEKFELFMTNSAREDYLRDNPNIKQTLVYAPGVSYNDAKKPDEGFRDVLRKIKKEHPMGNVNTF